MSIEQAMRRALILAVQGRGHVSPNPLVGCVILDGSNVIAEGWHQQFGMAHAEAMALGIAGDKARGSTVVCTLEPCSHVGRNPACAELLVAAGVARVAIGCTDPNPLVAGKGIARLRAAGIEVIENVLEEECRWMNRFFLTSMSSQRPHVILKVAQSIDGRVNERHATRSTMSTSESLVRVHELRAECDAVMVGADTAIIDRPKLNVRLCSGPNPRRVVLDSKLRTTADLELYNDSDASRSIVCCALEMQDTEASEQLRSRGVSVVGVEMNADGHLNLHSCMKVLYERFGICSVLVEAGARLSHACIEAACFDELHIFQSPRIVGQGDRAFDSQAGDLNDEKVDFKHNTYTADLIDQSVRTAIPLQLHSVHNYGRDLLMLMLPKR